MRSLAYFLAGAIVATGAVAHADDSPPPPTDPTTATTTDAAPTGGDQLTLPKGQAMIDAYLAAGLDSGAAFKPIGISPDLWYGVSDKFTIGLVHSDMGLDGLMAPDPATSLCLSGESNGCPASSPYSNVFLDARYGLKTGTFALAVDGGIGFVFVNDPVVLAADIGLLGRWHKDKIAIEFEPKLGFELTNRETPGDTLTVPITLLYSLNDQLAVAAQLAFVLPLESPSGASYEWNAPISIGAHYRVTPKFSANIAFSFLDLIGSNSSSDFRSIMIGGSYAL